MFNFFSDALSDIRGGVKNRNVWLALASEDIGDQHRRTTLGPIWMLLNYILFVGTFTIIFSRGTNIVHNTAYIAIGLYVWMYCSEVISKATSLFQREESFITGTPLALSVYVMRMLMQVLIRSGYAGIGCLAIIIFSDVSFSFMWLWSLAGIILIILITPAVIIIFAMASVWFPDMQFIISNIMRLGIFLTPIFWAHTGNHGIRDKIYIYNPFTWFLEIVRAPIVNDTFPAFAFGVCLTLAVIAWMLAIFLLGKLKKQIVFML